ncbi:ABC transporter permease [Rhodocytophaga rosea]|uniref:ABC transporter permease n=1 Tax=Rhodocytophaga rosea TaxID=2704465 RepID=A0A6C0GIF3_9BACT|nr:ABC transporter permease [Rhodocytophaga rosea]QHT67463.1 ABC transporter permease [Rhodocytophaga rosea]
MLKYLLKRIIWIIPTLWFITSVVFILSKLIPGDTFSSEENASTGNLQQDREAYQHYLRRTGQDVPLFYVSLHTLAEPDTLYRLFSVQEYSLAKRMIWQYGNWPAIASYMEKLRVLQQHIRSSTLLLPDKKTISAQTDALWQTSKPEQIQRLFSKLEDQLDSVPSTNLLRDNLQAAEKAFVTVTSTQSPYLNFIPALSWHGVQNQYHQWIKGLLRGSLGESYRDARPVVEIISEAIFPTLLLTILTVLIVFSLAILLNIFIVHEDFSAWRKPVLTVLYMLDTVPVFLIALLLLIFLASGDSLNVLPVYGLGDTSTDEFWLQSLLVYVYYLLLPALCLSIANLPYVTVQLYQAMQETATSDFIITARAKGVMEIGIVARHILRNALLPLITLFTGFFPALLGGALVIEVIFAIPGMGSLLVDSILARDFPLILGIVLVLAFIKVMSHIVADMLYYLADPRVRF